MSLARLPGIRVYTHVVLHILPFLITVFILISEYSAALLTSSECPTCGMLHYLYVLGTPYMYAALLTSSERPKCRMLHYLCLQNAPHVVCFITSVFGTSHTLYVSLLPSSERPTRRMLHYLRLRNATYVVCYITYVFRTPHTSYAALLTSSESPTCRKLSRKERRGPRRSSMLRQTLQRCRPKPEIF